MKFKTCPYFFINRFIFTIYYQEHFVGFLIKIAQFYLSLMSCYYQIIYIVILQKLIDVFYMIIANGIGLTEMINNKDSRYM